jgi:predicted dehydrogenase
MDLPVKVVGLADPNPDMAIPLANRYGLPVFADHESLFDQARPDAVIVATPTVAHAPVALAAIERGVHVLVEKPIAATPREAEAMIAAAQTQHVTLAVGYIERFNPAVMELKRRIDEGALGRVFMIHARRQSPYPRRIQDVGVTTDLATHELDMMHYLTGSHVVHLSAEVERVLSGNREDIVFGLLRFANGVLGVLDVNWVTPTTVRELTITGEKGMFVVNYLSQDLFFHENPSGTPSTLGTTWDFTVTAGNMTRYQIVRKEPLRSELESFFDAIASKTKPVVDGPAGLAALELALRIVGRS